MIGPVTQLLVIRAAIRCRSEILFADTNETANNMQSRIVSSDVIPNASKSSPAVTKSIYKMSRCTHFRDKKLLAAKHQF